MVPYENDVDVFSDTNPAPALTKVDQNALGTLAKNDPVLVGLRIFSNSIFCQYYLSGECTKVSFRSIWLLQFCLCK